MQHWYRGCATVPKTDEMGSSPICCTNVNTVRGYSSVGRAQHLQCWGRRFEPDYLHQKEESDEELKTSDLGYKCHSLILGVGCQNRENRDNR